MKPGAIITQYEVYDHTHTQIKIKSKKYIGKGTSYLFDNQWGK